MAGEARNLKNTNEHVRVRIDNVRKVFNGRNGEMVALNGVSLDIHDNEFICVVGPSGCGKSTLLNIIAGLLEPTEGKVYCDGKEVTGTGTERGVVFQQYALFPWLTVKKNVMFALEMRGVKGKQAEQEAMQPLHKRMAQLLRIIAEDRGLAFVINTDGNACPYINPAQGEDLLPIVTTTLNK